MANIGKKILSAFIEVNAESQAKHVPEESVTPVAITVNEQLNTAQNSKFREHFDQLFREANIEGPDYYEFAKMIEAMHSIPDEPTRFNAAFAGLTVQGLNKQKLLTTAKQYLLLLDEDASNFHSTLDATLQERVHVKQQEMETKSRRIQELSQELSNLHQEIEALKKEIRENEEKIQNSSGSYKLALENVKTNVQRDIEKINQYIH